MATAPKDIPQDMPPPGGYGPINIDRIPLRRLLRAPAIAAIVTGMTFGGFYLYSLNFKEVMRNQTEVRGARMAIHPILLAERDRAMLKNLRRLRDIEADLMKETEGWELGTYYGEPIFMTDDPEGYREPTFHEYFNLSPATYTSPRVYNRLWL